MIEISGNCPGLCSFLGAETLASFRATCFQSLLKTELFVARSTPRDRLPLRYIRFDNFSNISFFCSFKQHQDPPTEVKLMYRKHHPKVSSNYLLTESKVFKIWDLELSVLTERQRDQYGKAEVWDFPIRSKWMCLLTNQLLNKKALNRPHIFLFFMYI